MLSFNLSASLPEKCASRDELLDTFEQHSAKRYVYVSAPAGYGKTVSTLLWLRKTQRDFAWLTLDYYDNSPSLFYRTFCHTLLAAMPQDKTLTEFVSNPSFAASPIKSTMEFLLMFSWKEGEFALVFDDLHHITNTEILKSLPAVLRRLPTSIKVFFLSRAALPDALADTMGENKAAFLDSADLAFSPEEIRQHFARYGWYITDDEAQGIHEDTGGWIILLNMMALSDVSKSSSDKLRLPKLSFEDYFEKNIWDGLDEDTQCFLMKTSAVDSFTLELCELLTESENCVAILDTLIHGSINLSRMGDEYRYHYLLRDFLRERLQESAIEQKQLYHLAAEYYLEKHEYHQAAFYARKSGDSQMSMKAIQGFFLSKTPTLDQYYELAQVFDITELTDEECAERPILYMPNILSAYLCGDIKNTERFFDLFYAALPNFVKLEHPIANVAVTRLILDYRMKLVDLPSFMDSLNLRRDKKVSGQAAIVTMQMPFLHRSNRDYTEFLEAGSQEAVADLLACLLPEGADCFNKSVQSCLLMEQNRIAEAFDEATNAYSSVDKASPAELVFGASVGLAQLYLLKLEDEKARAILDQLHLWIEENEAHYLLKNLLAFEELQKLWDCDRNAAMGWLDQYFVSTDSFSEFYRIYQSFTTIRAYIVLSKYDEALAALRQLKKIGEGMKRPLDVAEADVLTAIVEWVLGKSAEAQERLRRLLVFLQPYNYIRVIANEGKAVLPILAAIIKDMEKESQETGERFLEAGEESLEAGGESQATERRAEADKTLYRFVKEVYMASQEQSRNFKGLIYHAQAKTIRLSPRQAYVLELLSKGYKNAEIVEISGLSLNTIRTHTKIIYQKLEVGNVSDAVAKAKQLGILK